MQNLFVIKAGECEDLSVYEQVFRDAGFRLIQTDDKDDLLLCAGALLYANEETKESALCSELTAFCISRKIPLLIIHDHVLYEELRDTEGVYDASVISMDDWKGILKPEVIEKKTYSRKERMIVNLITAVFCLFLAGLFGWRMREALFEDTVPVQTEMTDTILNTYGGSAAQVYSISSFGNTVYRGSGYAVTSDGYILTNAHVIDHPSSMYRIVYGTQTLPAEVIAQDAGRDLALLKIETVTHPLKMAESEPESGSLIWMIGWPQNGPKTAIAGVYSGAEVHEGTNLFKLISMQMYPGVSGSCIINEKGEVVGTASAMSSADHTIGLIVPYDECTEFLKDHIFNK